MKTYVRHLLVAPALVWLLALTLPVRAEESAPLPPTEAAAPEKQPALRRLDEPTPAPSAVTAPEVVATAAEPAVDEVPPTTEQVEAAPASPDEPALPAKKSKRRGGNNEKVSFGSDSTLGAGDSADTVVSILGSSTSAGEVRGEVISINGTTRITGGTVGGEAVAVLGSVYVNGLVKGQVVAVMGNVELGPEAIVEGELVCIGGVVKRHATAQVHGGVQNIGFGVDWVDFEWLHAWVSKCLFYARPLAFGPHLGWAWGVAAGFLGFYLLLALIVPSAVIKGAVTLEQRPGASLLTAVLAVLVSPIVFVLLAITGVGLIVVPFLGIGLFVAGLFGKAVMLAWLGRRITNRLGEGPLAHPAMAVLLGGLIVMLLYTVPVLGFVLHKLLGFLGVGVVLYAIILSMKREKPPGGPASPAAAAGTPPPVTSVTAEPVTPPAAPPGSAAGPAGSSVSMGFVGGATGSIMDVAATPVAEPPMVGAADAAPLPPPPAPAPVPPVAPAPSRAAVPPLAAAATLPRAGFWIRLAASLIDAILVGMVLGFLPHALEPNFLLLYAVYCVLMWFYRGTTVGGAVCGLRVVRLDDRPIDWMTAGVRALGGILSLCVAGVGFIWVAFDDQKQSWHDKIAGTTVVLVPKGTPLV